MLRRKRHLQRAVFFPADRPAELMFEWCDVRRRYGGKIVCFPGLCGAGLRVPGGEKDLSDATKDQQEGRKSLNFILSHSLLPWKLVEGKRAAALRLPDGHAHRQVRPACNSHAGSNRMIEFGDA